VLTAILVDPRGMGTPTALSGAASQALDVAFALNSRPFPPELSMRPMLFARVVFLALCALSGGASAAARGFDVRDLVALDRLGDPQVSPDGDWIAFDVRETDMVANKGVHGIWLVATKGGEPRRLSTKGAAATSPRWSNDGKSVYFLSNRSGTQQIWRLDLAGGESQQVSEYPFEVGSFKVAPIGKQLALTMEVFVD
jgi:hypothetical protein